MILFKKSEEIRKYLETAAINGKKAGFVPTMGALHAGHISLLNEAKKDKNLTIASIFVNPTQFNDPADFQKYPITIEKDLQLLEANGCDILFLPSVSEIYPEGIKNNRHYDLGYLETVLEGEFRPGHFQGVCLVVHRLLEIIKPDSLYMGQKDYQQCMVIRRLLQITGLDQSIQLQISPTLRESNGLAMSSRNTRLSEEEKIIAGIIYETLSYVKNNLNKSELNELKRKGTEKLIANGLEPDYVEIADANNLQLVDQWNGKQPLVALIAAFLGQVRLIDNLILTDSK